MTTAPSAAVRVAILMLALPVMAAGQARTPELSTTVDPTTISVGDRVTVTFSLRHAPEDRVLWPDPIDLGPFEVLDRQESGPDAADPENPAGNDERVRTTLALWVTAFELGELTLPAVEVPVAIADGDTVTLSSDPAVIEVMTIGRDEGDAIRDIKGPLEIPFDLVTLLPWLGGLAAVAALGYWLYRRYRRRVRPAVPLPVVPPRPAHEVAYEALDVLEASGLVERGEIKAYHIQVSDIVRVYLQNRFGIDAMEMTTGEVLVRLHGHGASSVVVADLRQVLDRCDLVKFAKFRPDANACNDLVPLSRRLVERTTPAQQAPSGPLEAHAA